KTTRLSVFEDSKQASDYVALQIATLIRERQKEGKNAILSLATGSTPKGVYEELVRMHQHEGLSFENVITFNLDEYYPIAPQDEQSSSWFMNQYLFSHVNINPQNIHIPHVTGPENHVRKYCDAYENEFKARGGVDLQLLGVGRNGHI